MRYRIKIVEQNDGKIIYYPQYNKRIVEDLFSGLIINFVTNWAFTWEYFREDEEYGYNSRVVKHDTQIQAEDFIEKERQRVHDENIKKKAEEIKKTTYKYF